MTNRLLHVLTMLMLFELGVLLVFLPWFGLWNSNYFLNHYPQLRPYLLHPCVRGAITGLGVLDIFVAAGMVRFRRRPPTAETGRA